MKTAALLLLLVAVNIVAAAVITIPISKNIPESNEQGGFLDTEAAAVDRLINYSQYMYAGEIQLGNSKQSFSVDFDTGSNLLWLTSSSCATCIKDGFKNNYDCTAADGCQMTTTPASVTYGDGSGVYGNIANVPVSIAGLAPVTEALLLVNKSVKNAGLNSDGLMGLGVYDEHNTNSTSFVNQLFKQGIISASQFSFYLGFGQNESELVIGGFDSTKIAANSPIYYHPIIINGQKNDSQRWSVGLSSVSFGTQTVATASGNNVAIVDSGTSLIILRTDVYKSFVSYLKANYPVKTVISGLSIFYTAACGAALPDLTFTLADVNGVNRSYSVPSSFYLLQNGNTCIVGVQGANMGDVQFILGDVFMRRFVSIFDYSTLSMGLATSTANPSTATNGASASVNVFPLLAIALVTIAGLIFITLRHLRK